MSCLGGELEYNISKRYDDIDKLYDYVKKASILTPDMYQCIHLQVLKQKILYHVQRKEYDQITNLLYELSVEPFSSSTFHETLHQVEMKMQEDEAANLQLTELLISFDYKLQNDDCLDEQLRANTLELTNLFKTIVMFNLADTYNSVKLGFICQLIVKLTTQDFESPLFLHVAYYVIKVMRMKEIQNTLEDVVHLLAPANKIIFQIVCKSDRNFAQQYISTVANTPLQQLAVQRLVPNIVSKELQEEDYKLVPQKVIQNALHLIAFVRLFTDAKGGVTLDDETTLQIIWTAKKAHTILSETNFQVFSDSEIIHFGMPTQFTEAVAFISSL